MDDDWESTPLQNEWHSLSLTHVEYPAGDILGRILSLFSLLPLVIIVSCVTLVIFRRDLHTISFTIGVALNELINTILKYIIAQERPSDKKTIYNKYGMPSSHAQMSWFMTIYLIFFIIWRLPTIQTTLDWVIKCTYCTTCVIAAILVCISRVYLEYHTIAQVCVGIVVGGGLGLSWFMIVHDVLTPYFPIVTSWHVSELLMIRDTTLIPNIMWFEYTNIRQESRRRQRSIHRHRPHIQ